MMYGLRSDSRIVEVNWRASPPKPRNITSQVSIWVKTAHLLENKTSCASFSALDSAPRMIEMRATSKRRTEHRSNNSAAIMDVQTATCMSTMSWRTSAVIVIARDIQPRIARWRQTHVAFVASGAGPYPNQRKAMKPNIPKMPSEPPTRLISPLRPMDSLKEIGLC